MSPMGRDPRPRPAHRVVACISVYVASLIAAEAPGARAAELPEAGGLSALPDARAVPVPLASPGFEDGAAGWQRRQGAFSIVEAVARTGKACLRFDASVPAKYTPSARQPVQGIRPGVYTLRFWVKTRGLKPPEKGRGGVRVSLEYHLKSGQRQWPSTRIFSGTAGWQAVALSVLIPQAIRDAAATISVHRYGRPTAGEAWLDDFSLERVQDPPIEAFLRYPNYRGYLSADAPQRVRLWIRVNDPKPGASARVEVSAADGGRKLASVDVDAGKKEAVAQIDAVKWPPGRYAVVAKLGDYEYPAYVIQKISAEQRKALAVWFDEHSVLHVRGRKVFPLGFYNTTRKFDVVDDGESARLDEMVEAPVNFNINYWWWPSAMATRRKYLAEMHKRGVWYLDTLMPFKPGKANYSPAKFRIANELLPSAGGKLDTQEKCDRFLTALAQRMRTIPGHAGWYVMDERPFGMVPAIFHQYTVLRRADPDHPTYGVSNRASELHKWRDALDVFGMDPYPLMNMKLGRPLSLAARETRATVEATQHSRPVWMVMQFFQGWASDRWPTADELRTMSLMAVTEGARGLFYWSFGNRALMSQRDPAKRKDYWQRAVKVTRELKSLEAALVAPDAPHVVKSVSDPRVRWRARQAHGKWYVFAYLPARKFSERFQADPVKVTFTFEHGQEARRTFRPDTADWFAVTPTEPR